MKKPCIVGCMMLLLSISYSWSQDVPPDTLWVPVIFYDYHADGKSDFERCTDPGAVGMKGMVQAGLDVDRKPIPTPLACPANAGNFPCACHLAEWFRVSGQAGSDNTSLFKCDSITDPKKRRWSWTNLVPFPGANGRAGEYVGSHYNAAYSTANVIIYDSLPFQLVPGSDGVYRYNNDAFFKLDGRGFGNEPATANPQHNFGFTMELHTVFKYKKGLTFNFKGDDDVWAFVNGELVMDLGGLHQALTGSFNLDNANLVDGQNYTFDLFYAERHSDASHILITSNIISFSRLDGLALNFFPPRDTIQAGDSISFHAVLMGTDSLGKQFSDSTTLAKNVTWYLGKTQQSTSSMRLGAGPSNVNVYKAITAYEWDTIVVSYVNPKNGATLQAKKPIYVKPGPPAHIIIDTVSKVQLTDPNFAARGPLSVTLDSGTFKDSVYAYLRDQFGNFVDFAAQANWSSKNSTIATVSAAGGTTGEGIVQRVSLNAGATWGYAAQGSFKDSVQIIIDKRNVIVGPYMDSAITRDINGNGYIDQIDVFFSKDSAFNPGASNFSVTYNGTPFTVKSVVSHAGYYSLILEEHATPATPQSAWTPLVTVKDLPGVTNGSVTAADGCPPVVWRVIDYSVNDKSIPDTVKVIMSEKITAAEGSVFTIFNPPSQTFYVWDSTGTVRLDTMLSGINAFYAIGEGDSTLVFIMTNGHELTSSNWMNLNAEKLLLRDRNGNFPSSQNQKVRVEMKNPIVDARPVPNPSGPTTKHVSDGTIVFVNNPSAIDWVKEDHGGTVISLRNLPVPADMEQRKKVTGYLKIYDVIGNVVNWASSAENGQADIFGNLLSGTQTATEVDLYWNGLNKRGMKVAPGVYRAVVYIDYHGVENNKNVRLTTKVGIVP